MEYAVEFTKNDGAVMDADMLNFLHVREIGSQTTINFDTSLMMSEIGSHAMKILVGDNLGNEIKIPLTVNVLDKCLSTKIEAPNISDM